MYDKDNHPRLVGHSVRGNKRLRSVQDVAEFICKHGQYGDVTLPKMTKDKTQAPQQKKKRGSSVQDLLGIRTFTKYGLATARGELLFYLVSPTNISVLSSANIEIKIRHLMMVLSAIPDIEITCTDSSECFDIPFSEINGRYAVNLPTDKEMLELIRDSLLDHGDILSDLETTEDFDMMFFTMYCPNVEDESIGEDDDELPRFIPEM